MVSQPHYLLFCDSHLALPLAGSPAPDPNVGLGRWQIVLERIDGSERLEAQDCEPEIHRDRLALLAVVRGLEALEQAGHVRLVTTSRYVDRGLRFGLPNWRDTNYRWESFGSLQPIRNADLWQRVDVAMQYHAIVCRWLKPHPTQVKTVAELSSSPGSSVATAAGPATAAETTANYPASATRISPVTGSALRPVTPAAVRWRTGGLRMSPRPPAAIGRSVDRGRGSRRQWWEMAANWLQSVNDNTSSTNTAFGT